MKIKTKDLWQSAFCLAKGAELDEVTLDGNGKREVLFIFSGPDVQELQKEFLSGQACCNVSRLRASMLHLKEQMFELLRA
jgi:hypothetical protein